MDQHRIAITSTIEEARRFLIQNPTEKQATTARIFNVNSVSLNSAIRRDSESHKEGQNKIMTEHEEKALHQFIRSLLLHGILSTFELVFNAIVGLKRSQNHDSTAGSSKRGFRGGWKLNKLHKIKTKPLPMICFEAAQEKDVIEGFKQYRAELKALNIRNRKNIINFDKGGFRLDCLKGQEIMMPEDMSQFYATSPDNWKSLIVIEMIDVVGDFPPLPFVIIAGQEIMASGYMSELPEGTKIVPSDVDFTSDQIAIEFLKHYIKHSNAGPEAE